MKKSVVSDPSASVSLLLSVHSADVLSATTSSELSVDAAQIDKFTTKVEKEVVRDGKHYVV